MAGFDITERPVINLSTVVGSAYFPSDAAWDCSIGGLPFMFALDQTRQLQRSTSQFRRQRIDQERDPGENSLDQGVWLRSVASNHYGAGQRFLESLEIDPQVARFRFYKSANVDVWTPGSATLGKSVSTLRSNSATSQYTLGIGSISGTPAGVLHVTDTTLSQVTPTGTVNAVSLPGASGNILSLTSDGTNYYAATALNIHKGALPSSASAGSGMFTAALASKSRVLVRWVKQRLMTCVDNSVYELTPTSTALPTAAYDHPNTAWVWTGIADGPGAIYLSGYANDVSAIYRMTVTAPSGGGSITLATPVVIAEMPRGEKVLNIYSYLGNYLAIATSSGIRVAQIAADSTITVGPIIVYTAGGAYDFVGVDRYLYATGGTDTTALDGATAPGIYRIDLSVEVDKLRFAYAQEAYGTGSNAPSAVTYSGSQVFYTVPGTGLIAQSSTTSYATDGWLEYGRINYSTQELKAWRSVVLRADVPSGTTVEVHASTTGTGNPSTWVNIGTLTSSATDGEFSLSSPAPSPTRDLYVALRLTGTTSVRPTVNAMSVRAYPAPKRTRILQLPLLCFDHERDRNGMVRGYDGGAWDRLSALESAEDLGSVVQYQDYSSGEIRSALIEQTMFSRSAPPSREKDNIGGVITVTLRLL
jgi:hypothetical protein